MAEGNAQQQGSEESGSQQQGDLSKMPVEELTKKIAELNRESAERRTTANSLTEENRALSDKLQALQDEKTEAERIAAEKKGEFEELYKTEKEEKEGLSEKYKGLREVVDTYLEKEIEKVPEDKRDAIPDLEPTKKLTWLQEFGHTLFGAQQVERQKVYETGKETEDSLDAQHAQAMKDGNRVLALRIKAQMREKNKNK